MRAVELKAAKGEICVMTILKSQPGPIYRLAVATGLPLSTLKGILIRLRDDGLVRKEKRVWSLIEL